MGYSTDFTGQFQVIPSLNEKHVKYLKRFGDTRRMKRDVVKASLLEDPIREAVDLPIGNEGEYFVGGKGFAGQDDDPSVLDHNNPPTDQPGLWCQWEPNKAENSIEWDGGEKFYNYVEWLEYLIKHFLAPWGYILNGEVGWQGEINDDSGIIYVENNVVEAVPNEIHNKGPSWR